MPRTEENPPFQRRSAALKWVPKKHPALPSPRALNSCFNTQKKSLAITFLNYFRGLGGARAGTSPGARAGPPHLRGGGSHRGGASWGRGFVDFASRVT